MDVDHFAEITPLAEAYYKAVEKYEDNMQAYWLAANGYMEQFKKFLENHLAPGQDLYRIWSDFWQIPSQTVYPNNVLDQALR